MKKYLKRIIIMLIIAVVTIISFLPKSSKAQVLQNIDYKVIMNKDGSMQVTETWDIDISHTNTLFKTFRLSEYKYKDITNVKVKDLESNVELQDINEEMYHVPEGYYYGLKTNSYTFEIAWGTGMEKKAGNRKYEISYLVSDVVNEYYDIQEIYWQFLAKGENAIPARNVTGSVTLPENVSNIENLMVWGHGQTNGEIKKVNEHEVAFNMKNLQAKARLEIRIVTKDKMFDVVENKKHSYNYMNSILREETQWAEEANEESQIVRNIWTVVLIIYMLILLINIIKAIKYYRKYIKENKKIEINDLKYYREIPREDATPTEAAYMYNFNKERLDTKKIQQKAVSATILNLCLKRKINIEVKKEGNSKENVYIKIIDYTIENLANDEIEILSILKKTNGNRDIFEISELNKFAEKKYTVYSKHINKAVNEARNKLYRLNLIDKSEEKENKKFATANWKRKALLNVYVYLVIQHLLAQIPYIKTIMAQQFGVAFQGTITFILIAILPLIIALTIKYRIEEKVKNKIAVLTQKGTDEKAKWKALVNFMNDYSLLEEKQISDLVIWEKYLVYATALGISEKIIENMKTQLPKVLIEEKWDEEELKEKYPLIYFAYNPIDTTTFYFDISPINSISSNVDKAYNTAQTQISLHTSSGSGGGGGFSGGGGGRWRPVAGMGGR